MLLPLAPFFEVHESVFVFVQVEHTFNDACETAGSCFITTKKQIAEQIGGGQKVSSH
jgi:hypothetical protein